MAQQSVNICQAWTCSSYSDTDSRLNFAFGQALSIFFFSAHVSLFIIPTLPFQLFNHSGGFALFRSYHYYSYGSVLVILARFCSTLSWRRNRTNVASEVRPRVCTLSWYVNHVDSGLTTVPRRSRSFLSPWSFCGQA